MWEDLLIHWADFKAFVISHLPNLAYGIITLVLGWLMISLIIRFSARAIEKSLRDATLGSFLRTSIAILLKMVLFITVLSVLGVDTSSFAAIIGAASLAIGLSFRGIFANFAAGALIIILKPFEVGDFITINAHSGTVLELRFFNTFLQTTDNKVVVLPNESLIINPVINHTQQKTRRVDVLFTVPYVTNLQTLRDLLLQQSASQPYTQSNPKAELLVQELADNQVKLCLTVWVKSTDYVKALPIFHELVKNELEKQGIKK
ncbi:MAG: mechanosensitive ion channel family protein [Cytophagales bacterium]|nr:MAG: mechanosensitive ion channel family protein [Cytophagales bacterium]TAF60643.1 MAG: mechanosensitive ion channel family protein [Cytophagales bacterium]